MQVGRPHKALLVAAATTKACKNSFNTIAPGKLLPDTLICGTEDAVWLRRILSVITNTHVSSQKIKWKHP